MHLAKGSCERESKDAWGASERDIWGAVMANGAHVQDVPVRCCVAGWGVWVLEGAGRQSCWGRWSLGAASPPDPGPLSPQTCALCLTSP